MAVSAGAGFVGSIVRPDRQDQGLPAPSASPEARRSAPGLKAELGYDEAVDYKAGDIRRALRAAAPGGVDVYFDNVGGEVLEAALFNMNLHGRIACCGAVSQCGRSVPPRPSRAPWRAWNTDRHQAASTLRGFVVMDFDNRRAAALAELKGWVDSGQLVVREDIVEGLENLPAALIGLLAGENIGKRMVSV